jgi:hypothetical protein
MVTPLPQNENEAAYLAFAIVDELINFLVRKGSLSNGERAQIFGSVAVQLKEGGSASSKRAAKFITDRVKLKPQSE